MAACHPPPLRLLACFDFGVGFGLGERPGNSGSGEMGWRRQDGVWKMRLKKAITPLS